MTLLQGLKTPQFLVKNKAREAYSQYNSIENAKKKVDEKTELWCGNAILQNKN